MESIPIFLEVDVRGIEVPEISSDEESVYVDEKTEEPEESEEMMEADA